VVLVVFQIRARKFHPLLYWATIVASTTAGTTMADFSDRSLGIGYAGGSALLLVCVSRYSVCGIAQGSSRRTGQYQRWRRFYWATITFSQTLGTCAGRLEWQTIPASAM